MNIQQPAWTHALVHYLTAWWHAIAAWFIKLLFAQLFLTTFSLPIILWWGLPISALTVVGNIIFNPFIALFLLFSTLLFFCELAYLPSAAIVWALEKLTDAWLWLVAQGSHAALFALPKPPVIILLGIAAISLGIMYYFRHAPKRGILAFALFLLLLTGSLKLMLVPKIYSCEVPYGSSGSRNMILVADEACCCLFDTFGVLRAGNNNSWVDFTLRPLLVTTLGRTTCDVIIVMRPTPARLRAACEIAQRTHAQLLVVPESACNAAARTCMEQSTMPWKIVPDKLLRKFCFNRGRQRTQLREVFCK